MQELAWISPSMANRFNALAIDFIIENYDLLCEGRWPVQPTSYTNNSYAPNSYKAGATFENPCCIIAEFHWRCAQCGRDGELFIKYRCEKLDEKILLASLRMTITAKDLQAKCNKVRAYITGRRKKRSYLEFIRH